MKVLKSLITLIVVISIGILVYFYVYKTEQTRIARESKERFLIQFDLNNLKSFTFSRPDSSLVFERGIGRLWNITEPIKVEAERVELYQLFLLLNESPILYNLGDNIENMDIYGLENPEYYVCFEYLDSSSDTLFIGNNTNDGNMSYVRFSSDNRVLSISRELTERFVRWPVNVFRSRTILNVIKDDITAFEIIRRDDALSFAYNGARWFMRTPWNYPANDPNIENLLENLSSLNKQTLVEEKTDDMKQYGLDDPEFVMTVSLQFGVPEKILLVGNKLTEPGLTHLWYAKQFDNDLIFTINDSFVLNLRRIKEWYLNNNPVRATREILTKIILETGERKFEFAKDFQGNWSVISPVNNNVDTETVNHLLNLSHFLLMNEIFAYEPTEKEISDAGIKTPKAIVSLFQGEQLVDKIEFGNTIVRDYPITYFRTSKTPIIYGTRALIENEINAILDKVFGS